MFIFITLCNCYIRKWQHKSDLASRGVSVDPEASLLIPRRLCWSRGISVDPEASLLIPRRLCWSRGISVDPEASLLIPRRLCWSRGISVDPEASLLIPRHLCWSRGISVYITIGSSKWDVKHWKRTFQFGFVYQPGHLFGCCNLCLRCDGRIVKQTWSLHHWQTCT